MSEGFLSRWSRKKTEAKVEPEELLPEPMVVEDSELIINSDESTVQELVIPTEADLAGIEESSDVSAFLNDKVPQALKNQAFKALFRNPKFNHVDMMDVYMDDYNTFTPLTAELRDKMSQIKELLSRPDLEQEQVPAPEVEEPKLSDDESESQNLETDQSVPKIESEVDSVDQSSLEALNLKHGQNDATGS